MKTPLFLALAFSATSALAQTPAYDRVMVVILENTDYSQAIREPFLAKLAAEGASISNYHGVGHPSEPNYMAMVAGDVMGFQSDTIRDVDARSLATLLREHGKSYRVYAENFPGHCSTVAYTDDFYARKHNPLISFLEVRKDPKRCERDIVGAEALDADIRQHRLPSVGFYIPNQRNDGHNTGVAFADKWLEKRFGPLLASQAFMEKMLVVVTFDESGADPTNHIYTILLGGAVKPGSSTSVRHDHYSMLRMIEDRFSLGTLGRHDSTAPPITGIWK